MAMMNDEGCGRAVLYLRQEGRGIGLVNKLKAYEYLLERRKGRAWNRIGSHMKSWASRRILRDYGVGAQSAGEPGGPEKMRLLTNNPKKMVGLEGYGLSVVEQVPIEVESNCHNQGYLRCKQAKMGHLLHM
jgi:3,4-dihydroxy 2-butanone 4-phosphate synthase/GTP cyclohydrolase II